MEKPFDSVTGFEWDRGNLDKNLLKHRVTSGESEQVFFNRPLVVLEDLSHSRDESRLAAFGLTDSGRHLMVIYTIRRFRIRVISARDMNRKERRLYEEQSG
jgi:uncharacterized protein